MKRYGNLWPQIVDFENLLLAARLAQKGKRFRADVLAFNYRLEDELYCLQSELIQHAYQPGEYSSFRIYDPKPRLISAAPYRDRVVHHALCNVIMPLFEQTFISDSYANRLGYGTHRALKRYVQFYRSSDFVLQCDVRRYFPSIDHEILKVLMRRKLKCKSTLWLIDTIIDYSNEQDASIEYFSGDSLLTPIERRKGLPIGNLTSQFMANAYLSPFDHFVKEELLCPKYLRYVDDFALFSDDHSYLVNCRHKIEKYLEKFRLKIHPIKSQIFATDYGGNFVGFRVLGDRIRVRGDNLRRARRRLTQLQVDFRNGKIPLSQLIHRLQSWESHLKHGDTQNLCRSIFDSTPFTCSAPLPKER